MKFFKWQINLKIKRLDADERILYLANKLIKEIGASGRDMKFEKDGKIVIPISCDIKVYDHYSPARLSVQHIINGWEVHGDYKE